MPLGVKKIDDMGVFTITCFFGLFAYIWLFICVMDNAIESWEAYTTFAMFFVLIILAFAADKWKNSKSEKSNKQPLLDTDGKPKNEINNFTTKDIYEELVSEKMGQVVTDKNAMEKRAKMKQFLTENFGHDDIQKVDLEDVKSRLEGESLVTRIKYRKNASGLTYRKPAVAKGQKLTRENLQATNIANE